jgi:hypothetical protein
MQWGNLVEQCWCSTLIDRRIHSGALTYIDDTFRIALKQGCEKCDFGAPSVLSTYYLSVALQPFVGPRSLFKFLNLYAVGRTPRTGDRPFARHLPAHRTAQTQNRRTQTSMPQVGFEPTIPVFKRAKTVPSVHSSLKKLAKLIPIT